ncbi:hypothetical protein MIV018L [Invertebrate iridescent virus 3]|uniref:Uncharacterized protein 018L n=1 Tax=Invertebrate iridescent virus 3 TaxID=345201 RepID=VF415_IIV3|nr:hypothetical protein MIV018L [Invertebrate iridescent virus 3]Q197E2.1 RecName: Full=Uncharacterized protein 018L [Invertebrate iridescent virus 3]ABF82048.1 hypothetical protein MIV018L [Invertebrate iridescent virus 3]
MSGGLLSLESALRTCKVNTELAARLQSHRTIGPASEKVCPVWNGLDAAGRQVCPDSFANKSPGCHSPMDRLHVENEISRPQYISYLSYGSQGVYGNEYGTIGGHRAAYPDNSIYGISGSFGQQLTSHVKPSMTECSCVRLGTQSQCVAGTSHNTGLSYKTLNGYY